MMRIVERQEQETLASGVFLFIFALLVVGCCMTALADDAEVLSTDEVVTLNVKNMT